MRKNYTFEINLPVGVSENLSNEHLIQMKQYLDKFLCENFDICNADIKIVTKITNN